MTLNSPQIFHLQKAWRMLWYYLVSAPLNRKVLACHTSHEIRVRIAGLVRIHEDVDEYYKAKKGIRFLVIMVAERPHKSGKRSYVKRRLKHSTAEFQSIQQFWLQLDIIS